MKELLRFKPDASMEFNQAIWWWPYEPPITHDPADGKNTKFINTPTCSTLKLHREEQRNLRLHLRLYQFLFIAVPLFSLGVLCMEIKSEIRDLFGIALCLSFLLLMTTAVLMVMIRAINERAKSLKYRHMDILEMQLAHQSILELRRELMISPWEFSRSKFEQEASDMLDDLASCIAMLQFHCISEREPGESACGWNFERSPGFPLIGQLFDRARHIERLMNTLKFDLEVDFAARLEDARVRY